MTFNYMKYYLWYFMALTDAVPRLLKEEVTIMPIYEPLHPIDPLPAVPAECCVSCGYSYCKSLEICVRPWETYCADFDVIVNPFIGDGH
tara:strand:- start:571 stop:837 length:267 start_codon:yes stop_codon:yes gene_type:complete